MLARNELIIKWILYGTATALCVLIQAAFCQRIVIWGVIPFLYPMLAAIPSTYEAPVPSTIFALCLGVFCDLLLPGIIPCVYTLTFPLIGLCASLLSRGLLPSGFLCSLIASAIAFLITDLFQCFLLWIHGQDAWGVGLHLLLREAVVTAPLLIPITLLYRIVFRKTHIYD